MTVEHAIIFVYWFWFTWIVIDTAKTWFNIKRLDDQQKQQLSAAQFDAWLKSSHEARKATPLYDAAQKKLINFLTEPQCSNATDSEVHLTANSRQCMEELEHYSTDCNNSSAMTRELPLSDESKQWIAKDTCSGRDALIHQEYMKQYLAAVDEHNERRRQQRFAMRHPFSSDNSELSELANNAVSLISNECYLQNASDLVRCSTAPTPTAEPQASATPADTPTVKGMDV